jgi:hypothetical protein
VNSYEKKRIILIESLILNEVFRCFGEKSGVEFEGDAFEIDFEYQAEC